MEILFIVGGLAVAGAITYKIIVAIKYRGMRYNWFRFRREGYELGLDKHDVLLMRNSAYESRVSDFSMMYTSTRTLDSAIIHSVENIRGADMSEDEKNTRIERLFLLRNKMDGIATSRRQPITSTNQIRKNQPVELIFERIGSYRTVVIETTERFFAASMPPDALDVQDYTWEGKKVRVKLYVPNDAEYTFDSKVLDQTVGQDGIGHITIEHTKRIARTQKRIFRRNNVQIAVSLYTLKITGGGGARKVTVANNIPMNGTIVNLSAGGLSVKSTGSLKENMLIKLDFSLDFENTEVAIGRILAITTIPESAERFFHVRFERISRKTRNNIFEYIYRAASDEKKSYAPKTIIPQRDGMILPAGAGRDTANPNKQAPKNG